MLRFIIGASGTGKTAAILERIGQAAREGGAILLVPEQLSFEAEKKMYRSLGPHLALNVEVLSFTRLCDSIFRELGGLADAPVSEAAKYLLMSVAVGEVRETLSVYRGSLVNASFLRTLVDTVSEFKTAGVGPQRLAEASVGCDGELGGKLGELSGIYGAYQALLERGYSDSDDHIPRACALLENTPFFEGKRVFVDGFTTFMAAEFELLGHAIAQAEEVTLALTCDSLTDKQRGMGVFSPVKSAAARLSRMAERAGVTVAESEILTASARYKAPELAHVSRYFLMPGSPAFEGGRSAVRLYEAADRYDEIEAVAADIAGLVRERGYRYSDIAVIARETGPYLRALESVFGRYGIPYFTDLPREAENHPLVAGLLHAVDAVRSNFDTEPVLLLAKCPVMGLDMEDVARLENYCYCWGVRGAAWLRDFTANPHGLAGAPSEDGLELLAGINKTRAALAEPLTELREALATGSGRRFAEGLYEFLLAVGAADRLEEWSRELTPDKRVEFLNESAQIWDSVMDILGVFGSALGSAAMKRARLCELLRLALGTAEISLPPQTLDQVLVGKADRIRPADPRAVFVIGAAEDEFPARVAQSGVFSDAERRRLLDAGLEISPPSFERSVLERFFAYFAVTVASERLTVSYPRTDFGGQGLLPSVMISQLKSLFQGLEAEKPARLPMAGDGPAFDMLAGEYGSGSALEAALTEHFSGGGRAGALDRMELARLRPPHVIADRSLARRLFGENMRLSPTRVERYFRCPFSYFAADGLALKKRRRVEFSPLESGSVIHNVMQVMVQRHGGCGLAELDDSVMESEITEIIRGYLAERVEDADKLPVRFRYLFTRLTGMLSRLLRRIARELAQSEFVPAAFELPISAERGVEPLRLETANGVRVMVEGVVDRVDTMEKNGKKYVRVIDYKSGAKTFSLSDVLAGINMQMLLYLFTIQENGRDALAGAIPAGILYMPVRESFVSAGRETPDGKVAAEREKQWRMNGLLLEDEDALRGMERELAGVFIPAKMGKNGLDARAPLAGMAEMGRLGRKVKELISDMAGSLAEGAVAAEPVCSESLDACAYCDYRAVCGFEPGDQVRVIAKLDNGEALRLLAEREGEEYDG